MRGKIGFAAMVWLFSYCGMAGAEPPAGSAWLDGGDSPSALILCHGRGKHPTWKVVDPLRKAVHAQLGFHTLSLQMPSADKSFEEYAEDFPRAYQLIRQSIEFLRNEKKVRRIYLMGHSMGARMASAFLQDNPDITVAGLILAGCRNNGGYPLNCKSNVEGLAVPILDIWGGGSDKDADAARERAVLKTKAYAQMEITDADHRFDDHENAFTDAVIDWLGKQ